MTVSDLRFVFLPLMFLLVLPSLVFSQKKEEPKRESCVEVDNKKALKYYAQGTDKKKYERRERMEYLRKAIDEEPDFVDALWLYSEELIKAAKFEKNLSLKPAERNLLKVIELCPDYDTYAYFYLGQFAFNDNRFSIAAKFLEKFLKYPDEIKKDEDYTFAKNLSKKAVEFAAIFENPVPFDPRCVDGVSTKDDEYLAIISPDNETMFFTRRMPAPIADNMFGRENTIEVFSMSRRTADVFDSGKALPHPFNRGDSYGGASVTPDNKHMYITVCRDTLLGVTNRRYTNCDIYTTDLVNGEWAPLRNLGPNINTPDGWESQPSITSDNNTLFFSSFREDSRGMDIYFAQRQANGEWGPAQNMGEPINTEKHEKSPFIHSDSQTLYFSSDGHTGVGGFDVFLAKTDVNEKWMKPKNIGYPINTENDEVGFFVSTDGNHGYFASNSLKGKCKGGYDVFSFPLHKEARPEEVIFVRGEVKSDDGTYANATVKIKNSTTQKTTEVTVDSTDGKYVAVMAVKKNDDLVITVKQQGKAFSSSVVKATEEMIGKPRDYESQVKEITVGEAYRLENINYATNSADLTRESLAVLDEFVEFLNENPSIKIAIHGHTDDVGKDDFNLALSTDRAFSVMAYLQQKSIDKSRLSFKGFGKTKPLVPNSSEANRALNRRTEFVITAR